MYTLTIIKQHCKQKFAKYYFPIWQPSSVFQYGGHHQFSDMAAIISEIFFEGLQDQSRGIKWSEVQQMFQNCRKKAKFCKFFRHSAPDQWKSYFILNFAACSLAVLQHYWLLLVSFDTLYYTSTVFFTKFGVFGE